MCHVVRPGIVLAAGSEGESETVPLLDACQSQPCVEVSYKLFFIYEHAHEYREG
jgi:hypothetical protein